MESSSGKKVPIVDGHLDLAENVTLFGRNLTVLAADIRAAEQRTTRQATVSLPDLERGGIAVALATVTPGFRAADVGEDFQPRSALYWTPEEAQAQALAQLQVYERWEQHGRVRLLKSVKDLDDHLQLWSSDGTPGLVLLMESADPIVQVRDLARWWQRGLRVIGLTYGDTRYGRGVGGGQARFQHGGLTAAGVALLEQMAARGMSWDISHLTEEGIWQGLDLGVRHVCASHATARALSPTDRQLSDDVLRAVAEREGIIGLVLYNGFLEPRWRQDRSLVVSLNDHVRRHAAYLAQVAGWKQVGLGSDLDGGFGREESPVEIDTVADLYQVGWMVPVAEREAVLSTNWLRFLRSSLPPNA